MRTDACIHNYIDLVVIVDQISSEGCSGIDHSASGDLTQSERMAVSQVVKLRSTELFSLRHFVFAAFYGNPLTIFILIVGGRAQATLQKCLTTATMGWRGCSATVLTWTPPKSLL